MLHFKGHWKYYYYFRMTIKKTPFFKKYFPQTTPCFDQHMPLT